MRKCSFPRRGIQKEELVVGGMEAVSSILTRLSLSCLRDILVEVLEVLESSLGWRERFWVTEDMVRWLRWGRQERRRGPGTG